MDLKRLILILNTSINWALVFLNSKLEDWNPKMKRQQNILQCFRNISRTEVSVDETCATQNRQQTFDHDVTTKNLDALKISGSKTDEVSAIPEWFDPS